MLNDLVEDGLISMYIESSTKDYIDTMMLDAALNVSAPLERASGGSPRRDSVQDEHGRKEAVKKLFICCNYATNQPPETWIKSLSKRARDWKKVGREERETDLLDLQRAKIHQPYFGSKACPVTSQLNCHATKFRCCKLKHVASS